MISVTAGVGKAVGVKLARPAEGDAVRTEEAVGVTVLRVSVEVGKSVGEAPLKDVGVPTTTCGLARAAAEAMGLTVVSTFERQPASSPSKLNKTKTNTKAVNFLICMSTPRFRRARRVPLLFFLAPPAKKY